MKAAVVVFLGTNCEVETKRALEFCGFEAEYVNFNANNLDNYDAVFLSGGFSYGDYIRSGRLAKFTPVVEALRKYIDKKRGLTVGICNGFQVLCEAHILKGALVENDCSKFICKNVPLELKFNGIVKNISLPIAHREGKYVCFEDVYEYEFLKDAMPKAWEISTNGDIILLSPASASWDQYKQCEDRGAEFKDFVHSLQEN